MNIAERNRERVAVFSLMIEILPMIYIYRES